MRAYNTPHAYYCGVDLHARTLFVHVLDHSLSVEIAPPDIGSTTGTFLKPGDVMRGRIEHIGELVTRVEAEG